MRRLWNTFLKGLAAVLPVALTVWGLLLLRSGERSLRMRPALTIDRAEIDEAYQRLRRTARDVVA